MYAPPSPDPLVRGSGPQAWIWAPPVPINPLTECLLVIGIVSALVGLMVPCGCHHDMGAVQIAKTRQDLDTLRMAIQLYETQEGPLETDELNVLLGRYLQELPLDPWGQPYAVDPRAGVVFTRGADGIPGGEPGSVEEDRALRFRDPQGGDPSSPEIL